MALIGSIYTNPSSSDPGEIAMFMYHCGASLRQISKSLNLSKVKISSHFKKVGFAVRGKNEYAKSLKAKRSHMVRNMYESGASSYEVSRELGLCRATVSNEISSMGITRPLRLARRKLKINDTAFSNGSEQAMYWAGFIAADGCMVKRGNSFCVQVGVSARDREHLDKLAKYLGVKVGKPTRKNIVALRVYSKEIYDDLLSMGITPNKTITLSLGTVKHDRNFWRGFVDGDGSLTVGAGGRKKLSLVGTREVLEQFCDFIRANGVNCRQSPYRGHGNCWELCFLGAKAERIACILYDGCTVALGRKMDKYRTWRMNP